MVSYIAKYKFDWQKDSTNPKTVFRDFMVLELLDTVSRYYSNSFNVARKKFEDDIAAKKPLDYFFNNNSEDFNNCESEIIEVRLKHKALKVSDYLATNAYYYEDKLEIPKWVILNDTITILNQVCQKAKTNFKGRDYEVWFAKSIPLHMGPWQFTGLPGLILRVSDTKKQFSFECYELKNSKGIKTEFRDFEEKKKIKKEKLRELKRLKATDIVEFDKIVYPEVTTITANGKSFTPKKVIKPYNPIDLTP